MADKEISLKINIEGVSNEASELSKLEVMLKNLNEERRKLLSKLSSKGIISNEDKLVLAAYDRDIKKTTESIKGLKKVVDTANDSLERKRQKLIELKKEYAAASDEAAKKMAPSINKLNSEILKSEQAIGVHQRNVGNYPGMLKEAAGGFGDVASSAGGATGQIIGAATAMTMATGPMGIIIALVAQLAGQWAKAKENIKLYLESADKLEVGAAGFDQAAEDARVETRKRLNGMIAEGARIERENMAKIGILSGFYTEDEKKRFALLVQQGKQMQERGRQLKNEVTGIHDKVKWQTDYNNLLQEEEKISDDRLAKETYWEELEAELLKQRAIVSEQSSTEAQKKQAAIDADIIANKLVKEKTEFVDRQIANITAMSEMTATQEAVEEQINGLLKERNTIQKEYYSDQVKINRLENAANRGVKGDGSATDNRAANFDDKMRSEREKQGVDEFSRLQAEYKAEQDAYAAFLKATDQANEEAAGRRKERFDQEIKDNEQKAKAIENIEQAHADAKKGIITSFTNLVAGIAGKNKVLQKASLVADKAAAIAEIIIQTRKANAALTAWGAMGGPLGIAFAAAAKIKNNIAAGIDIAAITAATITGLAGFYKGGKINKGVPIYIPGSKDNLLIAANNKEAVVNERQIAALGGTRAMRRAGVPGFENGGAVSNMPYINPAIPPTSNDIQEMRYDLRNLKISLEMHKVRSAMNELDATLEHQRI